MADYIKFLGWDQNRLPLSTNVDHVLIISHCHYGVGFSPSRKPKEFKNGDRIFLARMTSSPNDYAIFGRGYAIEFDEERDWATQKDIEILYWKKRWPCMLRVEKTVFIKGRLGDGITMTQLLKMFGPTTFVRSNEHALAGKTNINTRRFLAQQAFIELTSDSAEWLSKKFDLRLSERGKISSSFIRALGRPEKEI